MESRLTSATDGFSVSTVNRILSFLDLPDITCDGVEKAPSPSPTANPTASPTADPTASPVQPTKSPVAYSLSNDSPTTSPIQNKATPVHVPGNLCEEASLGWCAHQAAGYTCFPLSEVTDVLSEQGCKVQSLRLARCNTKKVKVFKTALPEELDVCEDTCLMFSGDMICVLAQERGRVRLTFRDGDGDPFALNLFLRVVNNPKRKCRQTNLPCVGPE